MNRLILLASCAWVIILASCATSNQAPVTTIPIAKRPPGPAFYVLKEGQKLNYPVPLPIRTPVFVDWTFSDGSKISSEGFRGWDINRDGRFDMLEVLDDSGKAESWVYDFDGDSIIDAVEQRQVGRTP